MIKIYLFLKIIFENKYEREFFNSKVYLTTGKGSNFYKKNIGVESYINVEINDNDELNKVFLLGACENEVIADKFLEWEKASNE